MRTAPWRHTLPRNALLSQCDVRAWFEEEEPRGPELLRLDGILESGKDTVLAHLGELAKEIDELRGQEQHLLSGYPSISAVFSVIDRKETPAGAKRDIIARVPYARQATTPWYLDERNFSVGERALVKEINRLRRRRVV